MSSLFHSTGVLRTPLAATALLTLGLAQSVQAAETPIGKPQTLRGMEIAAVYLQPIEMDPPGMMRPAKESDIHLEADLHAAKGNTNGFGEGTWLPYMVVKYELTKAGSKQVLKGDLMPMVASDGPHYGDNIKLMGVGKYHLKLSVLPPAAGASSHAGFGRHVDKETGVAPWFKPVEVQYDFVYAGTGKKGGY